MLELTIRADSPRELVDQLTEAIGAFLSNVYPATDNIVKIPEEEPKQPVIPQEEQAKNVEEAPKHEEPKQPTIEEVRAALRELRDRKGSAAVKELLKAYNADSLTELKPEDYLGALARAKTEV